MKTTHALVVKLVDTKDLKSLPLWECQFESGRGHHFDDKNTSYKSQDVKSEFSLNIFKKI